MPTQPRGFTLLELMVVLALVVLLTGLVAPRLWQWVASARTRSTLDTALATLQALPTRAFFAGERLELQPDGPASPTPPRSVRSEGHPSRTEASVNLGLPEGWRLEQSPALRYDINGMTTGARLRLWQGTQLAADWVVLPPAGQVRPVGPDDGPFAGDGAEPAVPVRRAPPTPAKASAEAHP